MSAPTESVSPPASESQIPMTQLESPPSNGAAATVTSEEIVKDATKATGDGETVLLENGADIKAAPLPATNETVEVAQLYSTARLVVVFISLCMCMLLAALDVTIVSTAMPTIVSELNGADLYGWVAIAYALVSTAVQPLYGKFSDIFGRKIILIVAVGIFLAGSAIAGASVSMLMLVIARAVQGLGGGGIQSVIFIIISEIVAPRERGKYQGFIGAVWGLSSIIGPLLGGVFTQYAGWRWCFYINLPIGAVAITACIFLLKVPKRDVPWRESVKKIDALGGITLMIATVLTLLALEMGGRQWAWSSAALISCLVIGLLFFPVFVFVELKYAKEPVIPMYLFKNRNFVGAEGAAFFQGGVLFSLSYYLPLWFQVVRGYSATLSGIQTLPFMLAVVFLSIGSGIFMTKTGYYVPVAQVGGLLMAIALPLIAIWTPSSSSGQEIGTMIMCGIGVGALLQTLILTVQVNAPPKDIGTATASVIFLRTLGGVFGIAVFTTAMTNVLGSELGSLGFHGGLNDLTGIGNLPPEIQAPIRQAFSDGLRIAYFALTAFGVCSFLFTLIIRHVPLSNMMQTKRGNVDGGKIVKTESSGSSNTVDSDVENGDAVKPPPVMTMGE